MHVTVNGLSFHKQELGAGERVASAGERVAGAGERALAGERTPVVMAHGLLLGTMATWYFTAAPAIAKERRVLLYDLRGHGRTERARTGYAVATMSRDLAALAAPFSEGPVDLVGHSFGALVALRFAIDHPDRVRRVVLVEAPLPPSRFQELEEFAGRTPEQMIDALPEGLRAFVAQGGRRSSRLLETIRSLVSETSLLADLRAEPDIPDADLARLDRPVLCAYGDRSSCRGVGDRLASVLPRGRLVVLPGGHYLHLDATADLTRHILEHLDG